MKKFGYSAAALSAFALITTAPSAYADATSQEEIAALKAQLREMAVQQQKAASLIEKLSAKVDNLQKQNSVQGSKVSAIQKQLTPAIPAEKMASAEPQPEKLARIEPASGSSRDGGAYLGLFGGYGEGGGNTARQLGTVFVTEAFGGPQGITATGKAKSSGSGVIGAQAGYEFAHGSSSLRPAVELEALYLPRTQQHANLVNQDNTRITEHLFQDTFPTDTSVVLVNAVVGFKTPYDNVTPYVGGGVGAAYVSVDGASSFQQNPAEPGINHFSSSSDSSALTAAAQLKAGVHVDLSDSTYLFGEYRYLFIGAHDQTFGGVTDPTHAATSQWTVKYDGTSYNMATAGLGVRF